MREEWKLDRQFEEEPFAAGKNDAPRQPPAPALRSGGPLGEFRARIESHRSRSSRNRPQVIQRTQGRRTGRFFQP